MPGKKFDAFTLFNVLIMLAAIVVTLYPLYYMAIVSISDGNEVMRGSIGWFPKGVNFKAYQIIFADPSIVRAYANTFLYTAVGTTINLLLTALCAYPLSRKTFYGRNLFTLLIVFTMFFDGGLIPRYLVVNSIGMMNTIWAIVLPPAINVWYMVMMRTFFQSIPGELHESAYMDGAHDGKVFLRVVLPLSLPIMATMVLFYAVWHWNSFFPALIYLNDKAWYPLQIILRNIVVEGDMAQQSNALGGDLGTLVIANNIKYGVVIVAVLPILLVYPFLQKYFVKGAMVGSLKG
ncbi:carbohydrate ABC transporter permease [Paenibacillus humicola]|uniref:carbohydrate ABC transporter permease n=1 Tax=Paenibacillus humicola TaxID=3110540 RepID=UPI00237B69C1|nr:carbohydrate ABC transporter permease [Paenibacillus humicola]